MARYTVTEALVKLKLTIKKIDDAIAVIPLGYVGMQGSSVCPAGFKTIQEFKDEVKAKIDSAYGLIAFRDNLKKAIVKSNAETQVNIGKKTMTVAEAIETKHSIASKKTLLDKLSVTYKALESQVEAKNSSLEARADQYVTQLFQQNPSATDTDKANARKNFISNNTAIVVTHEKLKDVITKLKEDIDEFETNVDVALSICNANTFIEVE